MRVLQLHTAYREAGGEDVVVAHEAAALRAAGHEVMAHVVANPAGTVDALRALAAAPWNAAAAHRVVRVVGERNPDVVAVHNTWFALSPAVVAAVGRLGVPVTMTLHQYRLMCPAGTLFHHGRRCHDCVGSHPWHAVAHRCYRDSAALSALAAATVEAWWRSGAVDAVSRFVVMTEAGRELFIAGGVPAERIAVRPHGVEDPGAGSSPPSASDRLVYVGRAVQEKGLTALLEWWSQRPRPLRLEIVGDGPALDRWRGREPDGVVLRGAMPRDEALAAMRSARAVVVPSLWDEPFGLVAVEAMACGRGVLSTGVGGLADIHGPEGGWVAGLDEAGGLDAAAWDEVLESVAEDGVADRVGAAGRQRYRARFRLEVTKRRLLEDYNALVAR